jgi:pimeloyl-ACP methyl ester carboxylesterase
MRSPVFFFMVIAIFATPVHGQQTPAPQAYPPPGRLVDIGGRKLHLNCTGKGSPTVILMAGGGAFSIDWALVQPKIAESTRVCSYDRAGLGWSDAGPAEDDDTVEETVGDLHTLLQRSGERGPYILVGASIAGIFIQAYQRAFPTQVAALVFSNSSNRVGFKAKDKEGLIWELTEADIRSGFPLPPSITKGPAPTHEEDPFDKLPPDLQKVRLWLDMRLWQRSDPSKAGPEIILSWRKEFLTEFEAMDTSKQPPLGRLPVVVIASDAAAPESARHMRDKAGPLLDYLSSNTLHVTATGSGHEIHLYQPDRVVEGIQRAVSAARTGTPLRRQPQ